MNCTVGWLLVLLCGVASSGIHYHVGVTVGHLRYRCITGRPHFFRCNCNALPVKPGLQFHGKHLTFVAAEHRTVH